MVVLILESVPSGLRGELSKWMLEAKAGVFVGTISGAVRDQIWEKTCRELAEGGATMIHSAANEQGFAIRSYGDTSRQVEEWEGLFLVRRPAAAESPAAGAPAPDEQPRLQDEPVDLMTMIHPAQIWAKSPLKDSTAYHPLICHLIDTAMVAHRLWQYGLTPAVRRQVSAQLGCATEEAAGRWVAFVAGLHDLGKATPSFAIQKDDAWTKLHKAGFKPGRYGKEKKPHQHLGTFTLVPLLQQMGFHADAATALAQVAGGHHGLFPTDADLEPLPPYAGNEQWEKARANMVRVLANVLEVDALAVPGGDLSRQPALVLILSGLTSVSDWIASDPVNFPYAGDSLDLPHYIRRARWLAVKALLRLGWHLRPQAMAPLPFQELFDKVPNPLQEQVIDLAPQLQGPSMVLMEYPMGGGKTEGALYLADYLAATAGQRGTYFALPTMATSNQMFTRVGKYLANRFPSGAMNLQLLHGHADLQAEFELLKQRAQQLAADRLGKRHRRPADTTPRAVNASKNETLLAAEWFTYRKRGLLAPFGVGTVDQALLSVLQTKHFFVRLFGLAGKVVVFDEIHAYDTYMRTHFAHLLTWLAACGTSVILLSATLPASTRGELLAAYTYGRGIDPAPQLPSKEYPRISWVSDAGAGAETIQAVPPSRIALIKQAQDRTDWMTALQAALAGGGCAAVIVNTVGRAQQVYKDLKAYFPEEELHLFHARFPFDGRMARERTTLARFGPGSVDRPQRAVLVATQVIEQSLDLDFDVMVTDLAPVDLLLQRSGRIWRHKREYRPPGITGPALWLLMPPINEAGVPVFESCSARVYDRHTLLRSWLALAACHEFAIPAGVEPLVETVYAEREPDGSLPLPLQALWRKTAADLAIAAGLHVAKAERGEIPGLAENLFGARMDALDEEDESLHEAHRALTRLGGISAAVVCLTQRGEEIWAEAEQPRRIVNWENRRPDDDDLRALLGCSLRISFNPGLAKQILALPAPAGWQGSAHLMRYRALLFSPEGRCLTDDLPLRLDPELGLVSESSREEEEL